MILDDIGKGFIKRQEGFRAHAYPDQGGWSIGYGHRITKADWYLFASVISKAKADELFEADLRWVNAFLNKELPNLTDRNKYAAIADFLYNIGETKFRTSTMFYLLQRSMWKQAAMEFPRWAHGKNHQVLEVLVSRRKEEQVIFLK